MSYKTFFQRTENKKKFALPRICYPFIKFPKFAIFVFCFCVCTTLKLDFIQDILWWGGGRRGGGKESVMRVMRVKGKKRRKGKTHICYEVSIKYATRCR